MKLLLLHSEPLHPLHRLWLETKGDITDWEKHYLALPPDSFSRRLLDMQKVIGAALWEYLKNWGVVGRLAKGQWTKDNGKQLLIQLLDTGVKVPASLFWFGIIPPIPGKVWSYVFSALSTYGFIRPQSQVHKLLKRYIYPASYDTAEQDYYQRKVEQHRAGHPQETRAEEEPVAEGLCWLT